MTKVIMGIGIPGSGKTTVLKPFAEEYAYTYISTDDIRSELTGDASDQSMNREVWQEVLRKVVDSLERQVTVVLDATFAKDFERKDFIQFAREHGAEKVYGIFASVSLEVANERNKARDRIVPEDAIAKMYAMLTESPPTVEDGFDSVFDIDELCRN